MRLLQPKELNTKINDQKKSEYDAGMFLAKKVDRLREELAEAEKIHKDTVERLADEFNQFSEKQSREKEIILSEIKILEEKRRILSIPLDAKWKKLKEENDKNTDFSLKLIERDFNLKKEEFESIIFSQKLDSREKKLNDSLISAENDLKIAKDSKTQAEKILNEAIQYKEKTDQEIKQRVESVSKRETDIAYRELDVENQLQIISNSKEDINRERKALEIKKRRWTT